MISELLQEYIAAEKRLLELGEKIGKHFLKNMPDAPIAILPAKQAKPGKKIKSKVSNPNDIRSRANSNGIAVMNFGEWCDRNGYPKPDGSRDKTNYNKLYARFMAYKKAVPGGKVENNEAPPANDRVDIDNDLSELI